MNNSESAERSIIEAFTALMCERPFSKISVVDICQKCNINRKSFYYHFRDKYDLMNRKFDMEFPLLSHENKNHEEMFRMMFDYLYENRIYYRKAFLVEGQNSFTEYLQEKLSDCIMSASLCKNKFRADFFARGITFATKEWMHSKNSLSPADFYKQLKSCINASMQIN